MSHYSVKYEGLSVTDRYLTVTFAIGDRSAKRVEMVKVPIDDLVTACVVDVLHQNIARGLKAYWESGQPPLIDV